MSEQTTGNTFLEKNAQEQRESKIKLNAHLVGQTVAFAVSIVVLVLEIIFSQALILGFACLGISFVITSVEKWLTYFSLKQKSDLLTAVLDSAVFLVCVLFVVLAIF